MSRDVGAATLRERETSALLWSHRGFLRKYKRRSAVSIAVQFFSNVCSFGSGTNLLFSPLPEFFSPKSNWITRTKQYWYMSLGRLVFVPCSLAPQEFWTPLPEPTTTVDGGQASPGSPRDPC